jgi:hypothetical protein
VASCSLESFYLVLLFNFEVALEKNIKKSCSKKKEIKQAKTKKGLCVYLLFVSAVALCD